MTEYKLNIGEVASAASSARYRCYGLGSCIGLFIQDRSTGFSAGAHILLPDSDSCLDESVKYGNVNSALEEIFKQLKSLGSNLESLRAKITGGANVVAAFQSKTGAMNVDSVIRNLISNKIFIAGTDVGGSYCRTATYESETGLLTVRIPQTNHYRTL